MHKKFKEVYKQIKKYNNIFIARHTGPDPDALASSIALRDIIKNKFPQKKVYAVGTPAARLKYLGILDKFEEEIPPKTLLIVVDTPDIKRIDTVDIAKFDYIIKIDHHPIIDEFGNLEIVDSSASSASQLVVEFSFSNKLEIPKKSAETLYCGIVSDTNRFLYDYTSLKTFQIVTKLLEKSNINFTNLYNDIYLKPLNELRLQGYIMENMIVTENGFGYIILTDKIVKKFKLDSASSGDIINNLNFIDEVITWAIFNEDVNNEVIRAALRSRGPVINKLAEEFNGGGHKYASGARLKNFNEVDEMIKKLDNLCEKYRED